MTVYRQRFFMCPITHTPGVCDSFSEPKNHLLEVRMPEHHRIQSWFAFFPDFIFHTHRRIQFGHNVRDRKSTRLNSSHVSISYAVFCLKKKRKKRKPRM